MSEYLDNRGMFEQPAADAVSVHMTDILQAVQAIEF